MIYVIDYEWKDPEGVITQRMSEENQRRELESNFERVKIFSDYPNKEAAYKAINDYANLHNLRLISLYDESWLDVPYSCWNYYTVTARFDRM